MTGFVRVARVALLTAHNDVISHRERTDGDTFASAIEPAPYRVQVSGWQRFKQNRVLKRISDMHDLPAGLTDRPRPPASYHFFHRPPILPLFLSICLFQCCIDGGFRNALCGRARKWTMCKNASGERANYSWLIYVARMRLFAIAHSGLRHFCTLTTTKKIIVIVDVQIEGQQIPLADRHCVVTSMTAFQSRHEVDTFDKCNKRATDDVRIIPIETITLTIVAGRSFR